MTTPEQLLEAVQAFNTIDLHQASSAQIAVAYTAADTISAAYLRLKDQGPVSFDLQDAVHEVLAAICDAPITSIYQLKDYELAALKDPKSHLSQLPRLAHRILWGDVINRKECKLPTSVIYMLTDAYSKL